MGRGRRWSGGSRLVSRGSRSLWRSGVIPVRSIGGLSGGVVCGRVCGAGACCGCRRASVRRSRSLARGETATLIAGRLGRAVSTVTREVNANGGRRGYRAVRADRRALGRALRPKPAKLACSARLRAEVERRLGERWSPEQIAARLVLDFPDDPEMRVSHETIYQSLYVQSRGALRRQLASELRTSRQHRKPRGSRIGGNLRQIAPISERPPEVDDRAVPGHWEGDLMIGKAGRSAIATLVERQRRCALLIWRAAGRRAESV